ncbi:MAG TPA: glycosyltransferase family 2 protein [Stellaceae bacterium]|nr:glycosyltransferase family 2 protein [Stellaceae bacterium]
MPPRGMHARQYHARQYQDALASSTARRGLEIAVLVPCYNEALTVAKVVADFRAALPRARIYVYDNNSGDETADVARRAGATVRRETLQGKGHVVRRMFADVEADIYVLVDGDDTYDAAAAPEMIERLIEQQLDLVNARRAAENPGAAYRWGHRAGNAALTGMVARIFGDRFGDMLSGYKVLSRRFVKSFPIITSKGFEIETELAVHALELSMPTDELVTTYRERPAGSVSKLRTYRDAIRILRAIFLLLKEERPLAFFTGAFAVLGVLALGLAAPIVVTFIKTGLVPRLPTAVLATGLMLLAFLSLACGLILDTVTRGRKEMKRLQYLALPAVGAGRERD